MMTCEMVREALALAPLEDDALLADHIDGCAGCERYRRQHRTLDVVLRAEMTWEAPAALGARLLALAANPAAALEQAATLEQAPAPAPLAAPAPAPAVPARSRPKPWIVTTVYGLTAAVVVLSLLVAWQAVVLFAPQFDLSTVLTQLLALPQQGLAYLNKALPESRYAIDLFLRVRVQLMWLLLVAVLWAALDSMNLQFRFRGREITL